jgi:hypothetical protein
MRARVVIIVEVISQGSAQVIFADDDQMIQTLSANRADDAFVQRQLHFPSILPQAKILLSKVGGSSRFTGSNDGLYIRIEISNQAAKASFYINRIPSTRQRDTPKTLSRRQT